MVDPLTTDDQNVPPYYITLAFLRRNDPMPWAQCTRPQSRSIGLAEFSQDSNYNTALDGSDEGGTFGYMVCHQQYFAALSADFLLVPTRPQNAAALTAYESLMQSPCTTSTAGRDAYSG